MARQTLTWIALPQGIGVDQRARVTAFALPRLHPNGGDASLGQFSFAAWPEHLRTTKFAVEFGGRTVDCGLVSDVVDAALWRTVFAPTLRVQAPIPERLSGAYGDVPVATIGDHVRALHQDAMPQPSARRSRADTVGALAASIAAAPVQDTADRLANEVVESGTPQSAAAAVGQLADLAVAKAAETRGRGAPRAVPLVADRGTLASAFARLAVFHQAPMREEQLASGGELALLDTEFHQRLTLLGDYPALLRRLGLVVELSFAIDDAAAFAAAGDTGIAIRALTPPALVLDDSNLPRTRYVAADGRFAAKTRGDDGVSNGFVGLARHHATTGEPLFSIVGFDVHAAGLQQLQFHRDGVSASRPELGLPSLGTIGVSLVQARRAGALIEAADALHRELTRDTDGQPVLLCAEDLIRGHRLDVRDSRGGGWQSLHRRVGHYRPEGLVAFDFEDEGAILPVFRQSARSAVAVREQRHDETRPDFVDETLCTWSGWSLSAPRPGMPMPQGGAMSASPPDVLPVSISFRPVTKSLPRLRFGTSYQLRLRTVDLAGNGPAHSEIDSPPDAVLPSAGGWIHRRFEPISAPVIASRDVSRAAHAGKVADPVDTIILRGGEAAGSDRAERLLLPPVVSAWVAEQHAAFDGADGSVPDASFTVSALRGEGPDLRLHRPSDPVPGLPDPAARAIVLQGCPGIPSGQVGRFVGGQLVLEPLALPSDFARPDSAVLVIEFAPAPAWPRMDGVLLRMADGSGPPIFDAAKRILTLHVAPTEAVTMRSGCAPAEGAAFLFATLDWALERLDDDVATQAISVEAADAHRRALPRAAALGLLPAISPLRDLRLEHAVPVPLAMPTVLDFKPPDRRLGDSLAFLGGQFSFDRASTGRLELHAQWLEPDGHGGERSRQAMVFAVSTSDGTESLLPGVSVDDDASTVSLRQLPVRSSDVEVEASLVELRAALFRLHTALGAVDDDPFAKPFIGRLLAFPVPLHAHLELLAHIADSAAGLASEVTANDEDHLPFGSPGGAAPRPAVDAAKKVVIQANQLAARVRRAMAELQSQATSQEFGDQRHRQVEYRVEAVSRFANRYPPGTRCTLASPSIRVSVPSSVRPPPPTVTRIVPTFTWTRSVAADGLRTTERRTGLRVFLELPWFSSGEGESLAVLLGDGRGVSRWAHDPVFLGGRPSEALSSKHFTHPTIVRTGLRLAGIGPPVIAVVHAVAFDAVGECFADLAIDAAPAYAPFVQLALARFQHHSVVGAELSEPCLPAPVQLLPRRQVNVRPRPNGTLEVEVAGATHESLHGIPGEPQPTGNFFRIRAQQRRIGTVDDLGWEDAPGALTVTPDSALGEMLWRGTVTNATATTGESRVLLEEFERWPTQAKSTVPTLPPEDRLVFAEVISSSA